MWEEMTYGSCVHQEGAPETTESRLGIRKKRSYHTYEKGEDERPRREEDKLNDKKCKVSYRPLHAKVNLSLISNRLVQSDAVGSSASNFH